MPRDFSRASTWWNRSAVATKAQCCMAPMALRLPTGSFPFGISKVSHPSLHLGSTADGIKHARKFHQHPVAGVLHNPSAVFFDFRIDQLAEMGLEAFMSAFLVRPHQPRVAGHIGGKDRGQLAFYGLFHGLPRPGDHSRTAAQAPRNERWPR